MSANVNLDNTACVVTSEGMAGIATIQLAGDTGPMILEKYFRGKQKVVPGQRIYYGEIVDPTTQCAIDQVIITCYTSEESPVAETLVEINCHGGKVTVSAISALLTSEGTRLCSQREWQKKLKKYSKCIENEALHYFLTSQAEVAAKIFLYQMKGCLRRALQDIYDAVAINPREAIAALVHLKNTAALGKALATPRHIVLSGQPNVGKSSLFNYLLKRERNIVDAEPGTTRDVISEFVVIRGIPFYLTDTAGLRPPENLVEQLGIEKSKTEIEQAQQVVWICDLSQPPCQDVLPPNVQNKTLIVLNKLDIPMNYLDQYLRQYPDATPISAITGEGVANLEKKLVAGLDDLIPNSPTPIVFEDSQEQILTEAIKCVEQNHIDDARQLVAKLLNAQPVDNR